ncbi:hypothetical protein [Endobacterium cereale]|uniref:hypothetical protein n=1 Tax=Endobacterium cereale TaxID=2663029 RepID=UPI001F1C119E|nr:hypothetical protein [Endobacterium cereale]MEB2844646.1 hypothetical protein [Endobacterium cereale]
MEERAAIWRDDLDALGFAVFFEGKDHGAACLVHRRAFRILIGFDPVVADCLAYYANNAEVFQAAAWAKIDRQSIPQGRSLNLNSRDIRRALGELTPADDQRQVKSCRVLDGNE